MEQALCGVGILAPEGIRTGQALIVEDGHIAGLVPMSALPAGVAPIDLSLVAPGGLLAPGFIDVQVNGGGGVLFNDRPSVEGIAAIAAAHRRFGTTGMLPTLISDDLEVVGSAIRAIDAAILAGVPGILGVHLEGPFLNAARKGIHDAAKFRVLDDGAIDLLCSLRHGRTLVTLAPETVPPGAIRELVRRGVLVAAGHTAADYGTIRAALDAGLTGFTHLFNAMTQFGSREPGAVGAALEDRESYCGLIVDGHHVHPASLRVALRAKGMDRMMLVTDAMPTVGHAAKSFQLGGRTILAEDGRCFAPDGTLAGSDLDMAMAVRNAVRLLGLPVETALLMASATPAAFLGMSQQRGAIRTGLAADLVLLSHDLFVKRTWIAGRTQEEAHSAD